MMQADTPNLVYVTSEFVPPVKAGGRGTVASALGDAALLGTSGVRPA